MVRRPTRKSIEELYAPKIETAPTKSQVNQHTNNNNNNMKGIRTERDFGGFLISSSTPYNATSVNGTPGAPVVGGGGGGGGGGGNLNSSIATGRRKSARPMAGPQMSKGSEKYYGKEEKLLNLDDLKQDHNNKAKTTRASEKSSRYNNNNNSNMYDNKHYTNYTESGQKGGSHHHHSHHHHSQAHSCRDDDKDDDTEEFFELIRQTVEKAIGKSISDLLNRNFRELSAKVERFSMELKSTNSLLHKLQAELNNKVVHYGEENSRHFRYLCMKSEYDKMFYQHHTMVANTPTPPTTATMQAAEKRLNNSKTSHMMMSMAMDCDKMPNGGCACHGNKPNVSETHKSSSGEQIVTPQSSEVGMREILEHIQRFCTQVQMGDGMKGDERMKNYRLADENMKKPIYDEEDDEEEEFQLSSDGMTPRSDDHLPSKYSNNGIGNGGGGIVGGGNSMRSCTTTRGGNGGGDA